MLLNFDFDGVIADSLQQLLNIAGAAQAEIGAGRPPTLEDFSTLENLTFKDLARTMGISDSCIPDYLDTIHRFLKHDNQEVHFYPGMADIIRRLSIDHKITVITAGDTETVQKHLDQHYLLSVVSWVAGGETGLSKAERIKQALAQFNYPPNAAFMIGDAISDIRQGKAAGVKTIAVAWGFQALALLEQEKPDAIAHTPEELLALLKHC